MMNDKCASAFSIQHSAFSIQPFLAVLACFAGFVFYI